MSEQTKNELSEAFRRFNATILTAIDSAESMGLAPVEVMAALFYSDRCSVNI